MLCDTDELITIGWSSSLWLWHWRQVSGCLVHQLYGSQKTSLMRCLMSCSLLSSYNSAIFFFVFWPPVDPAGIEFCGYLVMKTPELLELFDDSKEMKELMSLAPEKVLLRWMNFHLRKGGFKKVVSNFFRSEKDLVLLEELEKLLLEDISVMLLQVLCIFIIIILSMGISNQKTF